MAPLLLKQLAILLWKSWIIRKRHWISALFELFSPFMLTILMVYVRSSVTKNVTMDQIEGYSSDQGWQSPTYYKSQTYGYGYLSDLVIYYTPETEFTKELMEYFAEDNKVTSITLIDREDKLVEMLASNEYNSYYSYGIVFMNDEKDVKHLKFKIRAKNYMFHYSARLFREKYDQGPVKYDSYPNEFASVQIAISNSFIKYLGRFKNQTELDVDKVVGHPIPYPKYFKTPKMGYLNPFVFVGMLFINTYIIICPLIVKRITDEKVAKAKEMLKMMGLSDWVFWGSHYLNFLIVLLFQCLVNTVLYYSGFGGIPYVIYSDRSLFFIALALFSSNTILSCMLLTTVLNRPIIAVVVSVLLFQISHTLPLALLNPNYNQGVDVESTQSWRILSCFLPNSGIQWVFTLIAQCENYGYGVNWSNLWKDVPNYGHFSVGYALLLMFLSNFFYAFLIWYVDNIWPFQYGIPKPFYYPFLPSYWCPNCAKSNDIKTGKGVNEWNEKHFETEPTNNRIGIKCQHLNKIFNGKVAVSDVSLNIFSGQITVLLGHNGAGKTTTMNMITGIFPPTEGTAYINGNDIRTQTKSARRSMALCPQDNILYNELNVYQHLKLYAILKGHPWPHVDTEINKILATIDLNAKRDALSTALSGGMKRKLCLGIAMIANSEILVLDEPTSGMDPEARRHVWDVLQSIRSERTILLTTHYMEEADALGDRIAIMNEGLVQCCGSPMFLKKAFGAGYHLRIAKNSSFNGQSVLNVIRNFMPNAEIKSEINAEIIYSLESNGNNNNNKTTAETNNTSALLPQLFSELESRKEELNIETCGLTVTTMEDVFLRVGDALNGNERPLKSDENGFPDLNTETHKSIPKYSGIALHFQQFKALILKRFHFAKRYWPMIILQTILPSLLFMSILMIDYQMKKFTSQTTESFELNLNHYGNTEGFIHSLNNDSNFIKSYTTIASTQDMKAQQIWENPNNWTLANGRGDDITTYIHSYLVGAQVDSTDNRWTLVSWYNMEALHTLPISISILYQSILNYLHPEQSPTITVYNHPIPFDNTYHSINTVFISMIISCLLLVPLTVPFIGASYVLFPIHERVTNSKQLQLMTGISSVTFWCASFVFDFINHMIASALIFIVFALFDWNNIFMDNINTRVGLFFMFALFGFASIPLAYIISLVLKKPSTGYALLVITYLITGLILVLGLCSLELMIKAGNDFMSKSDLDIVLYFARHLPVFAMTYGIQKLYKVGSFNSGCKQTLDIYLTKKCLSGDVRNQTDPLWGCCENLCRPTHECYDEMNALQWDSNGVAMEFTFLIATGVLFLAILLLIEGNLQKVIYLFKKTGHNSANLPVNPYQGQLSIGIHNGQAVQLGSQDDSDVLSEKQRINDLVNNLGISSEAIVVKDLTKCFGNSIQAVNRLSFGVHKKECFGLLGVNGAGKTTTFRMLTADERLTDGNAWIQSLGLRQDMKGFQKQIGYCPQFDAVLNKMTGTETLFMFCRLRGVKEAMIKAYVNELVGMVDLGKHANKCTETYSGGNRRKLSLAIALCAAPPVIFLDEPTAGVDPTARRKIWSTLAHLQERYGSAFILTSHSMEECEALCSRVAIMVNGQFRCLGSVQHLRQKFGQGFTIVVKLKRELVDIPEYMASVRTCFQEQIPSSVLKDIHQNLLHYHITDTTILWSNMFAIMEKMKVSFTLEDYIISDTTLEQIFLSFARSQR